MTSEAALPAPLAAAVAEPIAVHHLPEATVCVDCGTPGVRAYCAACGQAAYRGRFTLRSIFARLAYYAWAAAGFFRVRGLTAAWRSLLVNVLGYTAIFMVVFVVGIVAVLGAFIRSLAG